MFNYILFTIRSIYGCHHTLPQSLHVSTAVRMAVTELLTLTASAGGARAALEVEFSGVGNLPFLHKGRSY